jgi:hypothetical protein
MLPGFGWLWNTENGGKVVMRLFLIAERLPMRGKRRTCPRVLVIVSAAEKNHRSCLWLRACRLILGRKAAGDRRKIAGFEP